MRNSITAFLLLVLATAAAGQEPRPHSTVGGESGEHHPSSDPADGPTTVDTHADDHGDGHGESSGGHGHSSRLSDEVVPPRVDLVPDRPRPLLELGEGFLESGPLEGDIVMPTGAVWRPGFLLFGTMRTGVEAIHRGDNDIAEWVNRLDLFGNLQLSGTERVLVGIRPFDADGRFTGVNFEPDGDFVDAFNIRLTTLFFEGDLGELLPQLDPDDSGTLDYGFSVGRQPHVFQGGQMLADTMDSIMVTRNSLPLRGIGHLRVTGLFAWNDINRGYNDEDHSALMFGLLSEIDADLSTIEIDAVSTIADDDGGDSLNLGVSATQRLGQLNTTFRVNSSTPFAGDTAFATGGTLLFTELSLTPHGTPDILYANAFLGIDEFSSAARDQLAGGPLGSVGILFAATGLGTIGSPLSNSARRAAGGSLGYQKIFAGGRQQLIFEAGGRVDTDGSNQASVAGGARYQRAFGQHTILFLDAFGGWHEQNDELVGGRVELNIKF